ncbi:MAG: AhpC/TSA family protein [Bacteroidetes bacterium]|nr:AhpC/TSA family protein [Bacteroidota bacterium]
MKKILYICIAITAITSCSHKGNGSFLVDGTIVHPSSKKILLEELTFGAAQPTVIDSTTLQPNGNFKLNGIAKEEGLYLLAVENGPTVLFINDSKSITINLDEEHYKNYTTNGSAATQQLQQFLENYSTRYNALIKAFTNADSLQKIKASDSVLTVASLKKNNELKKINEFVSSSILKSKSPALSYFIIGKAIRTMQPDEVQKLATTSAEAFKDHQGLAQLKKGIDEQIASDPKYALLNKPAPELNFTDTTGKYFALSNLKGKYVLVDFWASWCKPCREENPNVVAAYKKYNTKNFTVLGVSLDNDKAAWVNAINQDSLTWNHISDLKQWESNAVKLYHINAIPFNVLINPEGKIIATDLRGAELQNKLNEVLK